MKLDDEFYFMKKNKSHPNKKWRKKMKNHPEDETVYKAVRFSEDRFKIYFFHDSRGIKHKEEDMLKFFDIGYWVLVDKSEYPVGNLYLWNINKKYGI